MAVSCPSCAGPVASGDAICPKCSAELTVAVQRVEARNAAEATADAPTEETGSNGAGLNNGIGAATPASLTRQDTHLSPDGGVQAYLQPDAVNLGPHISGREIVHVASIRGAWAQVYVEGAEIGWVDGRLLLPPVQQSPIPSTANTPEAARTPVTSQPVNLGAVVGAFAAVGVIVGALLGWTQGVAVNSFKIPVEFVFDPNTTSHDPRIGYLLVGLGLIGLAVCFVSNVGALLLRALLGALALGIAIMYCAQIAHQISVVGSTASFNDLVGPGPWVTGISGAVLTLSLVTELRS